MSIYYNTLANYCRVVDPFPLSLSDRIGIFHFLSFEFGLSCFDVANAGHSKAGSGIEKPSPHLRSADQTLQAQNSLLFGPPVIRILLTNAFASRNPSRKNSDTVNKQPIAFKSDEILRRKALSAISFLLGDQGAEYQSHVRAPLANVQNACCELSVRFRFFPCGSDFLVLGCSAMLCAGKALLTSPMAIYKGYYFSF